MIVLNAKKEDFRPCLHLFPWHPNFKLTEGHKSFAAKVLGGLPIKETEE